MNWFVAQHGPRGHSGPCGSVVNCSDEELRAAVWRGEAALAELRRRDVWDARKESALYAWQIKDADKPTAAPAVQVTP